MTREETYEAINRLASNPETAKDALILWLVLHLVEDRETIATIASATAAYERKTFGAARRSARSGNSSSRG